MTEGIELKGVSYQYAHGRKESLRNVSCLFPKGKFIALLGPAGAGKSTLALSLNGLIPQLTEGYLTGSILLDGQDISRYPVQTLARHVGLVLQDAETQIISQTVEEDVAFGPRNYNFPPPVVEARVTDALEQVGLISSKNKNTEELSGGEKQRLALAGILALKPEFIILDEALAELDPMGKTELYRFFKHLTEAEGATVIAIEQDSEAITCWADEVFVLQAGQVAWQGSPRELFSQIPLVEDLSLRPLSVSSVAWGSDAFSQSSSPINSRINSQPISQNVPVITVTDLTYCYESQSRPALHQINLRIGAGEFVALAGRNGSGKTTLAKHFNGLLKPARGEVMVMGVDTRELEVWDLAQQVGYVFQNPDHQIFAATVEKELEYGLKNRSLAKGEIKQRVDQVLEWTELAPYRSVHPYALGKGSRQIVALASALVLQPEILVIDEPTTGLDWPGIKRMMKLVDALNRQGTTVIMISHDMDVVARYARRLILMSEGRILADGEPKMVFACSDVLKEAGILCYLKRL